MRNIWTIFATIVVFITATHSCYVNVSSKNSLISGGSTLKHGVGIKETGSTIKSDNKIEKRFDISDKFEKIIINTWEVTYYNDDTKNEIVVSGPEAALKYININISNDELNIGAQANNKFSLSKLLSGFDDDDLEIIVYSNSKLKAALVNGSGDLKFMGKTLNLNDFELKVQGSGDLSLECSLVCDNLKCAVVGSGDLETKFETRVKNNLSAIVNGSGDIKLSDINTDDLFAKVSGSGDIELAGQANKVRLLSYGSGDIKAKRLDYKQVKEISSKGSGNISLKNSN